MVVKHGDPFPKSTTHPTKKQLYLDLPLSILETRLHITNDSKHSGGSWTVPKAPRLVGKARTMVAKAYLGGQSSYLGSQSSYLGSQSSYLEPKLVPWWPKLVPARTWWPKLVTWGKVPHLMPRVPCLAKSLIIKVPQIVLICAQNSWLMSL
jgi:hypothetical protein